MPSICTLVHPLPEGSLYYQAAHERGAMDTYTYDSLVAGIIQTDKRLNSRQAGRVTQQFQGEENSGTGATSILPVPCFFPRPLGTLRRGWGLGLNFISCSVYVSFSLFQKLTMNWPSLETLCSCFQCQVCLCACVWVCVRKRGRELQAEQTNSSRPLLGWTQRQGTRDCDRCKNRRSPLCLMFPARPVVMVSSGCILN